MTLKASVNIHICILLVPLERKFASTAERDMTLEREEVFDDLGGYFLPTEERISFHRTIMSSSYLFFL
jgi:hypothetical protein